MADDSTKSRERLLVEVVTSPFVRNGHLAARAGETLFGDRKYDLGETTKVLVDHADKVQKGDLSHQRSILACQTTALDTLFTEMAERAMNNIDHYPEVAERYMRLALKAQANCRTTIETLDRIVREGSQTIKHVHVDNRGGQTVITDTITTGGQIGKNSEQCHAIKSCGASQSVFGEDPQGNGVPISLRNGKTTLPDARRDKPRAA